MSVPVDLEAVCRVIGVSVERRPMVPEGVLCVAPTGLSICLQNNFDADTTQRRRQRFTWAHEICHALLFDDRELPPKPLEGAPSGEKLENLCHIGARALLMPPALLQRHHTRLNPVSSLEDVDKLAVSYDVSLDVVLRRLHETDSLVSDGYALALIRLHNGLERVEAACFGAWLLQYLSPPAWGDQFGQWASPVLSGASQVAAGEWLNKRLGVRVVVSARSQKSKLIEFRRL
jgi:hypothetical protein